MSEMKEWTLMFYFASDNPLAPSIIPQLKSIKQAGFHQEVNVIAQFDPQPEGTPTHIFDVNLINKLKAGDRSQVGFSGLDIDDPFVSNLIEDRLWRDELDRSKAHSIRERLRESLRNSEHPVYYDPPVPPKHTKPEKVEGANGNGNGAAAKTVEAAKSDEAEAAALLQAALQAALQKRSRNGSGKKAREVELNPMESLWAFLKFCADKYPAHHYILFILGHGIVVGNDIFLFDENADEQSLSLTGLGTVLHLFKKYLSEKVPGAEFELASFHSCSVSSIEVAYELEGTANYMLASQGPAFVGSWAYRQMLIRLFRDTDCLRKLEAEEEAEGDGEKKEAKRQEIRGKLVEMFRRFTDYCFHNNKDFLLAGYSFDITLCDLRQVSEYFTPAIKRLREVLNAALDFWGEERYPQLRNLILLAHLEAQSEWQENYTDLRDFCFCLRRQCETFRATLDTRGGEGIGEMVTMLDDLINACGVVIGLSPVDDGDRRSAELDSGVVLKSEFLGPEHQYTHGLSVYFPWAQPLEDRLIVKDYEEYRFHKDTKWHDFLTNYFQRTQRRTRMAEINDERARPSGGGGDKPVRASSRVEPQQPTEEAVSRVQLSEDIASIVFNGGGGRLSGENSLATLEDKVTPKDRTGDACACASIKNYPRDTRDLNARQQTAPNPESGRTAQLASRSIALFPGSRAD